MCPEKAPKTEYTFILCFFSMELITPDRAAAVLGQLLLQQRDGRSPLCDVFLRAEDGNRVPAHRLVCVGCKCLRGK